MLPKITRKTTRIGKIIAILLSILVIPIIIINMVLIIQAYNNPEHLPSAFGIKPAIVLSGSMDPTFDTNALIFARIVPTDTLQEGDIITFIRDDQTTITHRIVAINQTDDGVTYITKGDANNTEDAIAVLPDQVEGLYMGHIAGLGGKLLFMQNPIGMLLCIIIPILLYTAWIFLHKPQENNEEKSHQVSPF